MIENPRFIEQKSFLNLVPLDGEKITKPYTQNLFHFFEFHAYEAMRTIGEIYVPRFTDKDHERISEVLLWVYIHKEDIKRPTFTKEDPEEFVKFKNRLTFMLIAKNEIKTSRMERRVPVTFLPTDPDFKKDIRNVLNPFYLTARTNSISLVHHEHGRDLKALEKAGISSSLFSYTINKMFMSNGISHHDDGADMLIGYMFLKYSIALTRRAREVVGIKKALEEATL